jgi:hypothetical protein
MFMPMSGMIYEQGGKSDHLGAFPNVSQHRFGHLLYISVEAVCFCSLRIKIGDTTEKF